MKRKIVIVSVVVLCVFALSIGVLAVTPGLGQQDIGSLIDYISENMDYNQYGSDFAVALNTSEGEKTAAYTNGGDIITKKELAVERFNNQHAWEMALAEAGGNASAVDKFFTLMDQENLLISLATNQLVLEEAQKVGIEYSLADAAQQIWESVDKNDQFAAAGNEEALAYQAKEQAIINALGMTRDEYIETICAKAQQMFMIRIDYMTYFIESEAEKLEANPNYEIVDFYDHLEELFKEVELDFFDVTDKYGAFGAGFLTQMFEDPQTWSSVLPAFYPDIEILPDGNNKNDLLELVDQNYFYGVQEDPVSSGWKNYDQLPGAAFFDNFYGTGEFVTGYLNSLMVNNPTMDAATTGNIRQISAAWNNSTVINNPSAYDDAKMKVTDGNVTLSGNFENLKEIRFENSGSAQMLGSYPNLEYIYVHNHINVNLSGDFPSLKGVYMDGGQLVLGSNQMGFNADNAIIINKWGYITVYTAKDVTLTNSSVVANLNMTIRGNGKNAAPSKFIAENTFFGANNFMLLGDMNDDNTEKFDEVPTFFCQQGISIVNVNAQLLQGSFFSRNDTMILSGSDIRLLRGFLFAPEGIDGTKTDAKNGISPGGNTFNIAMGLDGSYYKPDGGTLGTIRGLRMAKLPEKFYLIENADQFINQVWGLEEEPPATDQYTIVRLYDTNGLVNGQQTPLNTGAALSPVIRDGQTIVPIRFMTTGFGAEVNYHELDDSADITLNGITVNVKVGRNTMIVNGTSKPLPVATQYVFGSMFVPMRAVLEELGLYVAYDDETYTIIVVSDAPITQQKLDEQVALAINRLGPSPNQVAEDYILLKGDVNPNNSKGHYQGGTLDSGAPIIGGKQYIHARKLAALIGCDVTYNSSTYQTSLIKGTQSLVMDGSNSWRNSANELFVDLEAVKGAISGVGSTTSEGIIIVYNGTIPDSDTIALLTSVGKMALDG